MTEARSWEKHSGLSGDFAVRYVRVWSWQSSEWECACEFRFELEEPSEELKDDGCVPLLLFVRLRSRRQTNSLDLRTGAPELVFCLPSALLLPGAPAGSFSAMRLGTLKLQLAQVSP